jgi:3-oxoacid CoA-transferase
MIDTLLGALAKRKDVNNLTAVSNNTGTMLSGFGMAFCSSFSAHEFKLLQGKLLDTEQLDKVVASYPGG